jgi:FtsP/CotA-like multicopper oxidase with cupredoxin domain
MKMKGEEIMRRKKVGILGMGGFLLLLSVELFGPESAQATHTKFTSPLKTASVLTTANITIDAIDANVQVLSGTPTLMWTLGGDFPPPTIRRPTGNTTNVTFNHKLTQILTELGNGTRTGVPGLHTELSIHHHGSHVAPVNDGWACGFYFGPGHTNAGGSTKSTTNSRTYTYTLKENDAANSTGNERGVTEWYHNHRVDVTGHTAWKGLAGGFFIIDDPADPQTLPSGQFDVPLVIRDLQFDANNQIPYRFVFEGTTGDHILVNGVPQPFFNVQPRKYMFRVLVPGNARKYFMRLVQEGSTTPIPMTQIGTDSGLMARPVNRTEIPVGIAERVVIVIDFKPFAGKNLILKNNDAADGQCVPEGTCSAATADIMQFRVSSTPVTDDSVIPATLRALPGTGTPVQTRLFTFDEGTNWVINGKNMDCARTDADPVVNTREQWTLKNEGAWTHSIHMHDVDQICVSRNGAPCAEFERFKETWPMGPDVTFVVQLIPTDFTQAAGGSTVDSIEAAGGRYMLHCHVLEHEDLAMMTQFRVKSVPDGVRRDTPCTPPGSCTQ